MEDNRLLLSVCITIIGIIIWLQVLYMLPIHKYLPKPL